MVYKPTVRKAKRLACKASIIIEGLPGEGKSGLALLLAYILAGEDWEKVGHIDTENKSADLFVGIPCSNGKTYGEFLVCPLDKIVGFSPSNFLAAREALIEAGVNSVIKDSISHAWQYDGGVLDIVSKAKNKNAHYAKDKYAVWGDDEVVREKLNLIALIRDSRVHVITTVRVKEKMEYVDGEKGKELRSMGEQQIQQADLKYEPDLVLHMISPGYNEDGIVTHPKVKVLKSRYIIFKKNQEYDCTPEVIYQLKQYLEEGADPLELLELQRKEYVEATKDFLNNNPSARAIWNVMKKDAGFQDIKLENMPLEALKKLFIILIK